jgi:hypothetical protein
MAAKKPARAQVTVTLKNLAAELAESSAIRRAVDYSRCETRVGRRGVMRPGPGESTGDKKPIL